MTQVRRTKGQGSKLGWQSMIRRATEELAGRWGGGAGGRGPGRDVGLGRGAWTQQKMPAGGPFEHPGTSGARRLDHPRASTVWRLD